MVIFHSYVSLPEGTWGDECAKLNAINRPPNHHGWLGFQPFPPGSSVWQWVYHMGFPVNPRTFCWLNPHLLYRLACNVPAIVMVIYIYIVSI